MNATKSDHFLPMSHHCPCVPLADIQHFCFHLLIVVWLALQDPKCRPGADALLGHAFVRGAVHVPASLQEKLESLVGQQQREASAKAEVCVVGMRNGTFSPYLAAIHTNLLPVLCTSASIIYTAFACVIGHVPTRLVGDSNKDRKVELLGFWGSDVKYSLIAASIA
jgi:hypothetical protein